MAQSFVGAGGWGNEHKQKPRVRVHPGIPVVDIIAILETPATQQKLFQKYLFVCLFTPSVM